MPGVRVLRPDPGYPVLDIDGGTVLGPWGHTAAAPGVVVHELSCAEKRADKRRTRRESDSGFGGSVVELAGTTANVAQNHFGNYSHWLLRGAVRCELVQDTVGMARFGATGAPRRVYLTRGDAPRRRVVNREELEDLLGRRGFGAVAMDGHAITEQAELMGAAECVVAVHGAAMANLVFMPRDALLVELKYRNWPTDIYAGVAASTGVRYASLFGTEPRMPKWLGYPQEIDADTIVDVRALAQLLDREGFT